MGADFDVLGVSRPSRNGIQGYYQSAFLGLFVR